jgi:hypothetical protein
MLIAREFSTREPLPLHRIQEAIFEFCRGRADVVVFGAQAVNVYVSTPRMTQGVDLLCSQPREQADAPAKRLAPKGATDLADLRRLLLSHPELRSEAGPVAASIERTGGGDEVVRAWRELLAEPMVADESEDEGY